MAARMRREEIARIRNRLDMAYEWVQQSMRDLESPDDGVREHAMQKYQYSTGQRDALQTALHILGYRAVRNEDGGCSIVVA